MRGRIVKGIGGFYYIDVGDEVIECRARGRFRKEGITPMVGDFVEVSNDALEEILPRKNALIRPPVANIDQIAIVVSSTRPAPDFTLIDKLTVFGLFLNLDIAIIINKIDLDKGKNIEKIYKQAGFAAIRVSATRGSGNRKLKKLLDGKTTAFAGNSGVGKSSLLKLLGWNVEVGEVSKIARGKHTTRHSELTELWPNTFAIDTPGFSLLEGASIPKDELENYFPEFAKLPACAFHDCRHLPDEKGCAKASKLPPSRYASYLRMMNVEKGI